MRHSHDYLFTKDVIVSSCKNEMFSTGTFLSFIFLIVGCSQTSNNQYVKPTEIYNLYSADGREHKVQFDAVYLSTYQQVSKLDIETLVNEITETTKFLAGPLTERSLAGIQKGETITLHLDQVSMKNGRVLVPYTYNGVWLVRSQVLTGTFINIPVPISVRDLKTKNWKKCTASEADHSSWGFMWYFWDPARSGCDHQLGENYQEVQVNIGAETSPTDISFPEYKNLIRMNNGKATLAMTFAFGYVEDVANPNPFTDYDSGMLQFQKFYAKVKKEVDPLGFTETPIYQNEITGGTAVVGARFSGLKDGVHVQVSVIAAAGIDQMDLFADSYAKKHEGFFAWFGHSRVGGGFDADQFQQNLNRNPAVFSVSPQYQLIYWAGCNSYSYYTLPFFKLKSALNPLQDPNGTKKLDLISNGLPSLFSFNAFNANVLFDALINWEQPTSYQTIVNQIESHASHRGSPVIVNVLGDEDNSP